MNYTYYPGCSLKGMGKAYDESLRAVFESLGLSLTELKDWNCCGATAYMSIDEMKAFALAARNLALAEKQVDADGGGEVELVAPCAACYLVLSKAQRYLGEYPEVGRKIRDALDAVNLRCENRVRVRHPLDVLVNDVGLERIRGLVKRPLDGLPVASYYGCQIVRPYATFDNQHEPTSMDRLMQAVGAEPVDWPLKTRCCGGSLTGTTEEVGLRLNYILLKEAKKRGASLIVTACPLCQFNLECYQDRIVRRFREDVSMPVAYFTQLMGYAIGIEPHKLGLQRLFVPLEPVLAAKKGGGYVHA